MSTNIIKASKQDYARLSAIWESAVKATHDFLDSRDFAYYRSRMTDYFGQLTLYAYKDEQVKSEVQVKVAKLVAKRGGDIPV